MAGQAAVMHETDDGDELLTPEQPRESNLRPVETPTIRHEQTPPADQPLDFVEVDDDGNPLSDANLSQSESGDRPLIQTRDQQVDDANQRKLSRAQRRARQKAGRDSTMAENAILKRQVGELRDQLNGMSGEFSRIGPQLSELQKGRVQSEISRVEAQAADQDRAITAARAKIRDAMRDNDSDALLAAMEERDTAVIAKTRLEGQKEVLTRALKAVPTGRTTEDGTRQLIDPDRTDGQTRETRVAAQPELPPEVMSRVREFQEAFPWFDLRGGDIDSREVLKLDQAVHSAGYDRASDEYWDVLEEMMERRLPHRFADVTQPQPAARQPAARQPAITPAAQQRRSPPVAGAGERGAAPPNGNTVKLTSQRKNALIEVGVLDSTGRVVDRAKFQRYLRQYQDFDRANGLA